MGKGPGRPHGSPAWGVSSSGARTGRTLGTRTCLSSPCSAGCHDRGSAPSKPADRQGDRAAVPKTRRAPSVPQNVLRGGAEKVGRPRGSGLGGHRALPDKSFRLRMSFPGAPDSKTSVLPTRSGPHTHGSSPHCGLPAKLCFPGHTGSERKTRPLAGRGDYDCVGSSPMLLVSPRFSGFTLY